MITVDFSRLNIEPGYRILDIGCGTGRHACEVSRQDGVTVFGIDVSRDDLQEAKKRLLYHEKVGEHGGGPWLVSIADIAHLPFKDCEFDLVICSEVLEHIPDQKAAVRELVRILKPGKDLVVSVPRFFPERICWALSKEYHTTEGGHVRIYKKKQLLSLLEEEGIEKWAEHSAHGLHTPYWWLKCAVGPQRDDSSLVNLYHRLLVWDIMRHPWITRTLDNMLTPFIGKSIVVYSRRKKCLSP
ncbi:MAG: class I SAM-dependent methyltransferase [Proteobacteria bacterium]|nr:class I SAM-dependent methyltransferase [Pseudomonadota bacterium]